MEVAGLLATTALGEVAVMVKSVTLTLALAEWERVPLAPVMLKVYVPSIVELHATVAVPEPVMLAGVILPQLRPDGTVSVRLTVPVNPFRALIVIVVVADAPIVTGVEEVAEIKKSATA